MGNFSIKANLLKIKGAFVTNLKGKTATRRCLVIDIDESGRQSLSSAVCTRFNLRRSKFRVS